jgi:hypothetical protein
LPSAFISNFELQLKLRATLAPPDSRRLSLHSEHVLLALILCTRSVVLTRRSPQERPGLSRLPTAAALSVLESPHTRRYLHLAPPILISDTQQKAPAMPLSFFPSDAGLWRLSIVGARVLCPPRRLVSPSGSRSETRTSPRCPSLRGQSESQCTPTAACASPAALFHPLCTDLGSESVT